MCDLERGRVWSGVYGGVSAICCVLLAFPVWSFDRGGYPEGTRWEDSPSRVALDRFMGDRAVGRVPPWREGVGVRENRDGGTASLWQEGVRLEREGHYGGAEEVYRRLAQEGGLRQNLYANAGLAHVACVRGDSRQALAAYGAAGEVVERARRGAVGAAVLGEMERVYADIGQEVDAFLRVDRQRKANASLVGGVFPGVNHRPVSPPGFAPGIVMERGDGGQIGKAK